MDTARAIAMVTVIAATIAGRRPGVADDAPRRRGRGVEVVALLVPPHPSPGGYLAPNPTVGIGAWQIAPCRVVGHFWLLCNPPILAVENGLIAGKGTPRITRFTKPGGVRLVHDKLLLLLIPAPVSVPVRVSRVTSVSITRLGTIDVVVAGDRWSDVRHRPDVPNTPNAPVRVAVVVTMLVAGNITTQMMMVSRTATTVVDPAGCSGQAAW